MKDEDDEACPSRDDGIHCSHWWDGEGCCNCKARAMTADERIEQGMAMRKITDHIASPANAELEIVVTDEPGQGGANHEYEVHSSGPGVNACISFQNGPIKEFGVNGITQEVLLAIVIDRLRGFQAGEFKCRENAVALTKCEEALMWLQKRTRDRLARGVEGTNSK